jgi:hypothetical protein
MKLGRRKNGASVSAPLFEMRKNSDDPRLWFKVNYDTSVPRRARH